MCNGREGGGKQGENRTRPERMNERKREVQAERIWARERYLRGTAINKLAARILYSLCKGLVRIVYYPQQSLSRSH